jgi:hypothetical protein
MDPEYFHIGGHQVSNDILSESLTVARINDAEFVQPVDLAEDPEGRWTQASQYEIMNE